MPDQGIDQAEQAVQRAAHEVLSEVAAEFAQRVRSANTAGDLTAATFSVSRIAGMWASRVRRILTPLLAAAEQAAHTLAQATGGTLPDGWDDLPGRADRDPRTLPAPVRDWLREATGRLDALGDRLAQAARDTLTRGLDAGDSLEQLQARLLARFDADGGGQLGESRAVRVARNEATAAWHAASLAAADALPQPARPAGKRWVARRDSRTRPAHARAHGQTVPLDGQFDVGGARLAYPGDPTAPPALTVNCRCRLEFVPADRATSSHSQDSSPAGFSHPRETHMGDTDDQHAMTAADGGPYTSGMIALVPTAEHARRLAVEDGVVEDDLHLTLVDLGEADGIDADTRAALAEQLDQVAAQYRAELAGAPIEAHGFALSAFNPGGDTAIVLGVSGQPVTHVHETAIATASSVLDLPEQHQPWAPHVTLTYSPDLAQVAAYADRVGPIQFDRLRISYAGQAHDIPLTPPPAPAAERPQDAAADAHARPRPWSTPEGTALAWEDQETGDGRIFAPGALYWSGPGPWPLQHAEAMLSGHDGAELAGAIEHLDRETDGRITGRGVLYTSRDAGAEAIELLEAGAPLGVSVDLDDVDVEFVDRTGPDEAGQPAVVAARLAHMSLLPLPGGAWTVRATHTTRIAAAGGANSRTTHTVEWTTGPGGLTPRAALPLRALTAAAGDRDDPTGQVVHSESTGDVLMRITKGRVRGATLVAVPAYDQARIVLDPPDTTPDPAPPRQTTPDPEQEDMDLAAAAGPGEVMRRVIAYVTTSPGPVTPRQTAAALAIPIAQARDHLQRAAAAGRITRIARGLYVATASLPEQGDLSAAMSGDTSLPIHPDRDYEWDGDGARSRILAWATDTDGEVDASRLGSGFLYRDPDRDPATVGAYKLPFADVFDGELHIVPRAVFSVAGVLQGAMGGADIPAEEQDELRGRVEDLYQRIADALDDPSIRAPWLDDDEETAAMRTLEASAWTAMRDADPMPAAWFDEPTIEELPPGSGGVHYKDGRIYGWVAQAGEPHAGHPGRNLTIESLGDIDLTHFLRARFPLDDGSTVRAGAFTMNVPHSRDGSETDTAAAQFDDTRTVAGVVTVGMNARGMWFSGAAAPWLSDWDRQVFMACQPSYHMRQGRDGRWQLRAVLSVPVPGHSSPYTLAASAAASAMVQRSNLALAASAAPGAWPAPATTNPPARDADAAPPATPTAAPDLGTLAASLVQHTSLVDDLLTAMERRQAEREEARRAELASLAASLAPARELVASAAPKGP